MPPIPLLIPLLLLNACFVLLQWPGAAVLPWLAVETLLLAGLFNLLPASRFSLLLAWLLGAGYALMSLLALADLAIHQALGRSLNLILDGGLAGKGLELVAANLGGAAALVAVLVLLLWFVGVTWLVRTLLMRLQRPRVAPPLAWGLLGVGLLSVLLVPVRQSPVVISGAGLLAEQWSLALETRQASRAFEQRLSAPMGTDGAKPLGALASSNVMLGFVESYGMAALNDPRYRERIGPRLDSMAQALEQAGLAVVSGRLRSPVQGGESWLAHATLLSGLWVDSQLDYDILLASGYPTLIDDFRHSGHDTVAVMPAITRAWPEGERLRYNRIYDADSMGYEGPPLNWVTMPDQYTWSFFERRVRQPGATPVFAELALISSHAPWVPILPVLDDWRTIGAGRVFEPWQGAGEAPSSLWQDPERVRQHYARALDYSLAVATDYASRYLQDNDLLILLGDHQPAPLVTGEGASRDVPVHVISRRPELLQPFLDEDADTVLPGFRRGTWPQAGQAGAGMDALRSFLHVHYSGGVRISGLSPPESAR
ncbi:alkaline phosphatase family protein [Marinobacter bohaiensis]|uniref:hypothetical protein n=1 Tax=Marinobacter bohaiensis TaxID=2201898 RepID=UPI001D177586|nr:hypothetical protein [Marinobacter bohaiensis]